MRVADHVSESRLWDRHMQLAAIGALSKGGVNRPALSALDAEARALLVSWGRELDLIPTQDAMANLFLRRAGRMSRAPSILAGSHLDTQPTGGKFDGAYGVLAVLEAMQAMNEAGIDTKRPIELVAWTNEEGARFQPGCAGSAAFAGVTPLDALLAATDREGVSAGDAAAAVLARLPDVEMRPLGFPVAAYLEAHIEQGPRLEEAGLPIGIVTGLQGARWFAVEVMGREAHAGTTPMASRADALAAAADMVVALRRHMQDPADIVRFNVGRFDVEPGSPNTVPGRVFFTIDFRHPDAEVLSRLGDPIAAICAAHVGRCQVTVTETSNTPPTAFHPDIVERLSRVTHALGLNQMRLPSGAGHDARHLAGVCPTGMIFVPCAGGISHNEAESATPADLAAGARVLAEALVELAQL